MRTDEKPFLISTSLYSPKQNHCLHKHYAWFMVICQNHAKSAYFLCTLV